MAIEKNGNNGVRMEHGFFNKTASAESELTPESVATTCRQIDQSVRTPIRQLIQHRGESALLAQVLDAVQTSTNNIRAVIGLSPIAYESVQQTKKPEAENMGIKPR